MGSPVTETLSISSIVKDLPKEVPDSISSTSSSIVAPTTNISTPDASAMENIIDSNDNSSILWVFLRYAAIILILAFLGFNIFSYLGGMTGGVVSIFGPLVGDTATVTGETIKQTNKVAAVGAKSAIDLAADSVNSGITLLEDGLNNSTSKLEDSVNYKKENDSTNQKIRKKRNTPEPVPDDAGSKTQMSNPSGKAGYCYIGEDRGYRSCMKVGERDSCMSGEIFPTKDICINPNLR